ncbi:MAG TPA: L-aspartate oxidase [Acidimicrobiia bacterium]|nr:L-aspartate oxidase [Acidimicrobiia bacterium]
MSSAEVVHLEEPLVVGAGVAGLTVALALPRATVLVPEEPGSTWWAQGGIAVAMAEGDDPDLHAADTVEVSGGLAVEEAVQILTEGGPDAVERLMALGANFDTNDEGDLLWGREAGHSRRRILHADGDATGAEVMRTLTEAADASDSLTQMRGWKAVDLVHREERIVGTVVTDDRGHRKVLIAPAVVLATGGVGRIYAHTTNPPGVTGDGIAMAARAGARLADMEFMQFHPTALAGGKDPMPLLTEALRGEGAILIDGHGRRFMPAQHSDAELAPRDVVARAIWWQLDKGAGAYLDARSIVNFPERFPTVFAHAVSMGFDPRTAPLPVSPAAHYFMGGIDADPEGRTSLAGLWAVGECASTGVHGANRLASNSLLEGLVFGATVAAAVDRHRDEGSGGTLLAPQESLDLPLRPGPALEELRRLMWERVGLVRIGNGLWEARNQLLELDSVLRRSLAGRVAADVARFMIPAALRRSESRGSHYRADYPEPDPLQAERLMVEPTPVELTPVA